MTMTCITSIRFHGCVELCSSPKIKKTCETDGETPECVCLPDPSGTILQPELRLATPGSLLYMVPLFLPRPGPPSVYAITAWRFPPDLGCIWLHLYVWTPHDQTLSVPHGQMFLPPGELLPDSFWRTERFIQAMLKDCVKPFIHRFVLCLIMMLLIKDLIVIKLVFNVLTKDAYKIAQDTRRGKWYEDKQCGVVMVT